ncbi:VOC family protein [Bacillus sp. WLY-B-L8]|uniref:VOC family protein n=1 Tax=Bacillus multifaciens TaxID=3068506 RepID=UPI002740E4FF|nr:VOC family protein [Bacillus sp. WLY-B-L8]MDP7980895.1 VOC family protein [Bacillus sp. WLY-B-L8]
MDNSSQKITTFLMFRGTAEEAMNHYTSIFDQSEIISISRYGANEAGEEGTVLHAAFSLKGQRFMCIDSSNKDVHQFTPAMSLFVSCETEEEIDRAFDKLSQDGAILMPLTNSPWSAKFGWVQDKYGVSWQLNLAKN